MKQTVEGVEQWLAALVFHQLFLEIELCSLGSANYWVHPGSFLEKQSRGMVHRLEYQHAFDRLGSGQTRLRSTHSPLYVVVVGANRQSEPAGETAN